MEDPIVEEVRRIRDELARKFNYDVHAIFEDLRARDAQEKDHPIRSVEESLRLANARKHS